MKKTMVAAALGAAAVVLILAISGQLASTEAGKCEGALADIKKFRAAEELKPVSEEPFIVGEDELRTLQSYKGKGIVLNFWATWCAPCIEEMPELLRLKSKVAGDGIEVLAISQDRKDIAKVREFLEVNKLSELGVMLDKRGRLGRKLGVRGLPTTVLIDPQGRDIGRVLGIEKWDSEPVVEALRACLTPETS